MFGSHPSDDRSDTDFVTINILNTKLAKSI